MNPGEFSKTRLKQMQKRAEIAESKLKDALNDSDELCEQFNEINRAVRNAFYKIEHRWPKRGREMTLEEIAKSTVEDLLRVERLLSDARKRKPRRQDAQN